MANPFAVAARMQGGWSASAFDGARNTRALHDWAVSAVHPDWEVRHALRPLRARARDLARNNPYATGVVDAFCDNIIGWEGIRLKPRNMDPSGDQPLRQVNWEIERAWEEWREPENASADERDSWLDLERLIVRSWVTDGEVFIRLRPGYDNRFGFAVQLIDPDLLDETFNVPPDDRGIEIRMGVEIDRNGRHLAYHFFKRHPSEGMGYERTRIPAREIIHHFVRYRIGQTRGFSLFAPVLTTVKHIDGLTEAELVASRLHAAKMGFITNNTPEAIAAYATRLQALMAAGEEPEKLDWEVTPGVIDELMPGQGFEGFDPQHPNGAFEPFLKLMLRGVARGFSISYLTMTGDLAEANYSSMRAGLLPERDHWKILQVIKATHVHRRVYRAWLPAASLTGAVRLPTSIASDWSRHEWRGRGWKWVDPLKDLQALELGVRLGVDSRQHGASEQGRDFETVVDELKEEQEYAQDQGVDIGGSIGRGASVVTLTNPEEEGGPKKGNRIAGLMEVSPNGKH